MGRAYIALILPPSEKMTIRGFITSFLKLPPLPVPLKISWARVGYFYHVVVALATLGNQDQKRLLDNKTG
jgi:hypothetical protein